MTHRGSRKSEMMGRLLAPLVFVLLVSSTFLSLPIDKVKHIAISSLVASISSSVLGKELGIVTTLLLGITKEIYDVYGPGTPDIGDVAADICGIVIAFAMKSGEKWITFYWEF